MTAKKTLKAPAVMHALKPLLSDRENRRGRRVVSMDDAVTAMRWLENIAEGNTPAGAHARTLHGLAQCDDRAVGTVFVFEHDMRIQWVRRLYAAPTSDILSIQLQRSHK